MRKTLIVIVTAAVLAGAGYWFASGGRPDRAPAEWLTARPIAHKGLWHAGADAPENSLAAFRAALAEGHPIELDVQLSADGEVVVFHDYELERMTGTPGQVAETSLADLRRLRLGGGAETIPTLAEVLELADGRVPLFVEIKNEGAVGALEDAVVARMDAYDGPVAVMSFNPLSLARIAEAAPEIPRGQLASAFRDEDLAWYKKFLLRHLLMNRSSRPDFIAYDIAELPTPGTRLQKLRGRPLIGWTAETPAQRVEAQRFCDVVICDAPALP